MTAQSAAPAVGEAARRSSSAPSQYCVNPSTAENSTAPMSPPQKPPTAPPATAPWTSALPIVPQSLGLGVGVGAAERAVGNSYTIFQRSAADDVRSAHQ